jgi:hypothetical protein
VQVGSVDTELRVALRIYAYATMARSANLEWRRHDLRREGANAMI